MTTRWTCVLGLWAGLWPAILLADRVHMANGGVVKGKVVEDLPAGVRIKTVAGELFIARDKITSVSYQDTAQDTYEQAKRLYEDTASDQFKLSQWCARHRLRKRQRQHLRRTIKLDPDHAEARRMLGYVQHEGKWVTREEHRRLAGYVKYKGRWVLPLDRERLAARDRAKDELRGWYRQCRTIAALLVHRDVRRRHEGDLKLAAIKDPRAIKPMHELLGRQSEPVRLRLVEALGRFTELDAKRALVTLAVEDASPQVRQAAVTQLGRSKDPVVLALLTRKLKPKDRPVMLRAADALAQIGDLTVVPALIGVLVTRHAERVAGRTWGVSVGRRRPIVVGYDATVERGAAVVTPRVGYLPPNQVSAGGTETRVVMVPRENRPVLDALIRLTGKNFVYSTAAWRAWYKTIADRVKAEALKKAAEALLPDKAPGAAPAR